MKRLLTYILVLLVIGATAFGGWYLWLRNDSSQNNQAQKDPSEGGKYLIIKEWGVRFELPASLKGSVTYGLRKSDTGEFDLVKPPGTKQEIAKFETTKLSSLPGNCRLFEESDGSGKNGGFGPALIRVKESAYNKSQVPTGALILTMDEYAFFRIAAKASCTSSEENISHEAEYQQKFFQAMKKLEVIR